MNKFKKASLYLTALLGLLLMIGTARPAYAAKSVTMNASTLSMEAGDTFQLKMIIGGLYDMDAKGWRSGKPSVATVSSSGLVTAKKAGTATIYCTTGFGFDITCEVTVKKSVKISLSKYLNKKYTKLAKKSKKIATKLSASQDPAGIGNVYVFKTDGGTSLFFRYDTKTKKITMLQNSEYKSINLYGVKIGMTRKAAYKKLKSKGWKFKGSTKDDSGRYHLTYKKSGHMIYIVVQDKKVVWYQWYR